MRKINNKIPKNCHDWGLEAIDDCESEGKHIPADETKPPCSCCRRNLTKYAKPITDFYSETWTLLSDKTPTIEDPDPHERELVRFLHEIVDLYVPQKGEVKA